MNNKEWQVRVCKPIRGTKTVINVAVGKGSEEEMRDLYKEKIELYDNEEEAEEHFELYKKYIRMLTGDSRVKVVLMEDDKVLGSFNC